MHSEEIRNQYDATATGYDWKISLFEQMSGAGRLRASLLQKASGQVLDVACGTGRNFAYYPSDCTITGIDLSAGMLAQAQKRAQELGRQVVLHTQDAEKLTFPSQSFDTVVSSLAVCTYPHPTEALKEMARVCKPTGRLLLMEHGRSNWPVVGKLQNALSTLYAKHTGCHINREPLELAQEAGLTIVESHRCFLGILHTIVAKP